jgi:hypothetical protein
MIQCEHANTVPILLTASLICEYVANFIIIFANMCSYAHTNAEY